MSIEICWQTCQDGDAEVWLAKAGQPAQKLFAITSKNPSTTHAIIEARLWPFSPAAR